MKKVFIRGNKERGSEVIKMLEDLGGVNSLCLKGKGELRLYYVNKDNQIKYVLPESESGILIQECFEELHLPEKKELPNSWKEWIEQNSKVADEYFVADNCIIERINSERRTFNSDDNLLATQEDAEAILALIKLKRLRDTYRQGWIPNWEATDAKHCIERFKSDFKATTISYHTDCFLAFQSEKIRDKFYENFKGLIEQAKEFI